MNKCNITRVPFEAKNLMSYWDGEKLIELDVRGFQYFKEVTQQQYNWVRTTQGQVQSIYNFLFSKGDSIAKESTVIQVKQDILAAIKNIDTAEALTDAEILSIFE